MMRESAVVLSQGLHSPWNMGEAVLARNFTKILLKLYNDVRIISTIDKKRGKPDLSDLERQGINVTFCYNEEELSYYLKSELKRKPNADVHFINSSIQNYPGAIWREKGEAYQYQFAYRMFNIPSVTLRAFGTLALSQLGNLKVITTCLYTYKKLGKLFRRNYCYVPAPLEIPYLKHLQRSNKDGPFKVIYLGHGKYSRLPYVEVLKALRKLDADGYNIKLDAYISKLGYVDYTRFTESFRDAIYRLHMNDIVKIRLANLTESEKYRVLAKSDALLFPLLASTAIDPPLVILEAMALACCVIATPVQSVSNLLGSSRGIIIKKHNLEAEIYTALKLLADEPQRLKKHGTNARRWVISTHSSGVVYENMKRIVEECQPKEA